MIAFSIEKAFAPELFGVWANTWNDVEPGFGVYTCISSLQARPFNAPEAWTTESSWRDLDSSSERVAFGRIPESRVPSDNQFGQDFAAVGPRVFLEPSERATVLK